MIDAIRGRPIYHNGGLYVVQLALVGCELETDACRVDPAVGEPEDLPACARVVGVVAAEVAVLDLAAGRAAVAGLAVVVVTGFIGLVGDDVDDAVAAVIGQAVPVDPGVVLPALVAGGPDVALLALEAAAGLVAH